MSFFSSQHPKAKDYRGHCCNVIFLHVRQRFAKKIYEDHQQASLGYKESISLPSQQDQTRAVQYEIGNF